VLVLGLWFYFYYFIGIVGSEPWVVVLWWLVFFFPPWFSDWSCVFCVRVKLALFCFVVWVLRNLLDILSICGLV
jgi:hypothetical protein